MSADEVTKGPVASRPGGPLQAVAFWLAVWFGCGLLPLMPGTWGTLGALPLYLAVAPGGPFAVLACAALITVVGIWSAGVVARARAVKDPQIVCIDEVAGVLIALAAAPRTWVGVAVAVVAFRVGDQLKPWPARTAERRLPGGWGIVLDDVVAGLWAAALVLALRRFGVLAG